MPTIKDVARACGLSQATVSQVLHNGRRPVSSQTRERVLQAAQGLNYRPNAVAQGLARKRMDTLGVAVPHLEYGYDNSFRLTLLNGILKVCTHRRQLASLCTFPHWGDAENALALGDGRCDGVLLLGAPINCPLREDLRQRNVPLVLVSGHDPSGRITGVDVDNVAATRILTQHLLDLGHRRIAFLYETLDRAYSYFYERQEGYRQAMTEADLLCHLSFLTHEEEAVLDWSAPDRPTALICTYDAFALYLMERLQQRGIRVPEDVSVVGFDDLPEAASGQPPLTTVRQPITQIGERATEMLLALLAGSSKAGRQEYLPTELVIRESAAPPLLAG